MPPRYRIIILPEVAADIERIFRFIEKNSPQNAVAVARRLIEAIDSLEYLPHRFKVHLSSKRPQRIVHSMSVRPFILYYHVIDRDRIVEVLTIRHGASRQPRRFK